MNIMSRKLSIGVAFITHEARRHLPYCLPPLLNSPFTPRVLVVNSSSGDGTVELAREMGAETLIIPRSEFNHGTARELARKHLNTDIVVLMTPDAYAVSKDFLEPLLAPLFRGEASISYARQIPHAGASFFEAFPRQFNYPDQSHIRGLADLETYGVYTFFCSNACAAYVNAALDQMGGFPAVLFGEDTFAAATLLRQGHKIAYVAESMVRHSHDYSLIQEFRRHFDIGLVRKEYQGLLSAPGRDSQRGRKFLTRMMQSVAHFQPKLLPYACLHVASKWCGYRLGRLSYKAPNWFKRLFSSQAFYWKNQKARRNLSQ
jgi:rhamnosyltransferase